METDKEQSVEMSYQMREQLTSFDILKMSCV